MKQYDVAAFVWPAFSSQEIRDRIFWEEGIGEWQTVQRCRLQDQTYQWNRRPLWGYQNEADPYVMAGQIEAAFDFGVNVFIYDWYWYDGRPFLNQCLENGYLQAKNKEKVKFYIMWANHDVGMGWDVRYQEESDVRIWKGAVNRSEFEAIARIWLEKYFSSPCYYRIDDQPVLAIYDIGIFIDGLGGVKQARNALDWLRCEALRSGLNGVHIQAMLYDENSPNMSGFDGSNRMTGPQLMQALGVDSVTNYQYIHFMGADITKDYTEVSQIAASYWDCMSARYPMPYYPHVSIGWDPSPRRQSVYPYRACNNTPAHFQEALLLAREYVDQQGGTPLIILNSWNEWTETSYLQPDNVNGYGYLEAVKAVFKK